MKSILLHFSTKSAMPEAGLASLRHMQLTTTLVHLRNFEKGVGIKAERQLKRKRERGPYCALSQPKPAP